MCDTSGCPFASYTACRFLVPSAASRYRLKKIASRRFACLLESRIVDTRRRVVNWRRACRPSRRSQRTDISNSIVSFSLRSQKRFPILLPSGSPRRACCPRCCVVNDAEESTPALLPPIAVEEARRGTTGLYFSMGHPSMTRDGTARAAESTQRPLVTQLCLHVGACVLDGAAPVQDETPGWTDRLR